MRVELALHESNLGINPHPAMFSLLALGLGRLGKARGGMIAREDMYVELSQF